MISVESQQAGLRSWLQTFLASRNLDRPDGRALFRYRLSEQEFIDLQRQLKVAAMLQGPADLKHRSGFVELWMLYAAEWWKRCYDGDAWSWRRIFDSIQLDEMQPSTRGEWVDYAIRYWRLSSHVQRGHKFIGQVALNGGVPLRLIEGADGRIAWVLKMVLRRVVPVMPALSLTAIRQEVTEHANHLPQTLQQPMLLDLLAEIVFGVNTLTHQCLHEPVDDPIQHLDQKVPDWRELFPLELDSESARRLLTGLLHEASKAERQPRHPFVVRRGITFAEGGAVHLAVRLELAPRFALSVLAQLLDISSDSIPVSFDLSATQGSRTRMVGRAVTRSGEVRLETLTRVLPEDWFAEPVRLVISRFGEALHTLDIPGGTALESDVPLIFEDVEPFARLLRVGSASLRAERVLALMPDRARVKSEQATPAQELTSPLLSWRLYRFGPGDWSISNADESYSIVCGAASDHDDLLLWQGRRLALSSHPAEVFLGQPRLSRFDTEGISFPVPSSELYWVTANARHCLAATDKVTGAGKLVWQQGKLVRARLAAVCLPTDAAIRFEAGVTPTEGRIQLVNWPVTAVAGAGEGVQVQARQEGKSWRLDIKANGVLPPTDVHLTVFWPAGGEQRFTVPFPAKGVVLVQENGHLLPPDQSLTASELTGLRARMLSPEADARWTVNLSLRCRFSRGLKIQRTFEYRAPTQGGVCEVRLFELAPIVRQMLGSVEELDAKVDIDFVCKGEHYPGLQVTRYGYDVETDMGQGVIRLFAKGTLPSPDALAMTQVYAVSLLRPDAPIELAPLYSEGVATGAWDFNPARRDPGTWLIYPAEGSASQFRPKAWPVPAQFAYPRPKLSPMRLALAGVDRSERMTQLGLVLDQMAENPDHEDWPFLGDLVSTLGHLPVATLDVWVALGWHPRAMTMAVLYLDGFADRLLHRLAEELPFQWELTQPEDWTHSLQVLKAYWQRESDRSLRAFIREAKDTLAQLTQRYPALCFSLNLARAQAEVLVTSDEQDVQLAMNARMLGIAPKQMWQIRQLELFAPESGFCQALLRRGAESTLRWPEALRPEINRFAESELGRRLLVDVSYLYGHYRLPAVAYPLMLAFQLLELGAAYFLSHPDALAALREYREFDRDWFETAYQAGLTFALIERQNNK